MSRSDPNDARVAALLELAESRFHRLQLGDLRRERDRRTKKLESQHNNVSISGRAVLLLRLERELLEKECRRRIACYAEVAREKCNSEVLSERRLNEFRDRIMTSVRTRLASLKSRWLRAAQAAGVPAPHNLRFNQFEAEILDIANVELRVLAVEGRLAELESQSEGNSAELKNEITARSSVSAAPTQPFPQLCSATGQAASRIEPETKEQRSERRQQIVMPILQRKGWKPNKWATKAGVAKNSVYRFLDGTIESPSAENRRALAAELGLKEEDLPE